jgi:predicted Zn-dependent protease
MAAHLSEKSPLYGREKLLNLLEDFLKLAPTEAHQVELALEIEQVEVTRYAHNRIHQNVSDIDTRLWVRVWVNGAVANLSCNSLEPSRVKATIAQATATARRLPDRSANGFSTHSAASGQNVEPGSAGLAIPQPTSVVPASYFDSTLYQTPDQRAEAIGQVVELVTAAGLDGYGTYKTTRNELAVANSLGLRAYALGTSGYLKALVETLDGSSAGYADQLSRDITTLDPAKVANIAIQKCRLNRNQIELPAGDYEAVLEPNTVADLVRFMVIHGCGAQQLQDKRSFMTDRFGEQVTGSDINLWEDPNHPAAMPFPLDYEGLQKRAVPLVIGGKAAGVVYDRESAANVAERVSTGHALNPWITLGDNGPLPQHIVMKAGTRSIEDLVEGLTRGLIITRLHYTHCPDPRRVVATGTTRDGTFLVENGEIVAAVKNMRLTQSVLEMLSTVEEFGEPKTCQDWWTANGMGSNNYYLPALRVARCTFTGSTTF